MKRFSKFNFDDRFLIWNTSTHSNIAKQKPQLLSLKVFSFCENVSRHASFKVYSVTDLQITWLEVYIHSCWHVCNINLGCWLAQLSEYSDSLSCDGWFPLISVASSSSSPWLLWWESNHHHQSQYQITWVVLTCSSGISCSSSPAEESSSADEVTHQHLNKKKIKKTVPGHWGLFLFIKFAQNCGSNKNISVISMLRFYCCTWELQPLDLPEKTNC